MDTVLQPISDQLLRLFFLYVIVRQDVRHQHPGCPAFLALRGGTIAVVWSTAIPEPTDSTCRVLLRRTDPVFANVLAELTEAVVVGLSAAVAVLRIGY